MTGSGVAVVGGGLGVWGVSDKEAKPMSTQDRIGGCAGGGESARINRKKNKNPRIDLIKM